MAKMTKDEARSFLNELGKSSDGLKKLLTELAQKAEAKTEAEILFPDDPKEGQTWSVEIKFFHLLFEEQHVLLLLNRAVYALSEGVLKISLTYSNEGNRLKLSIPD